MHPVAQQRKRPGQKCFLPPRGGFNLRCTQSPSKSLKDWAQCLRQLNFKNRLLPTGITISFIRSLGPSPRRKRPGQECFLPPRGGFNLRCTQSPSKSLKDWAQCLRQLNFKNRLLPTGITKEVLIYDAPSGLAKNVFFLREEVLIYDAPESATFPRMFSRNSRSGGVSTRGGRLVRDQRQFSR